MSRHLFSRGTSFKIVSDEQEQGTPDFNGCGVSNLVFTRFMKFLLVNGYHVNDCPDFYIISSCSVTNGTIHLAERTILQALNTTDKPIILYGCFSGVNIPEEHIHRVHFLSGRTYEDANNMFEHDPNYSIDRIIVDVNDTIYDGIKTDNVLSRQQINYQEYNITSKQSVLISRGCNYNCTYCNIKANMGSPKSISIPTIVDTIKNIFNITKDSPLYKEEVVYLTSDDPGSYGTDIDTNIIELINNIIKIDPKLTIAMNNLYPTTLLTYREEFLDYIRSQKIVYLCVPLQTGSDRILKLMGRAQTKVNEVVKLLEEYKRLNPKLWLYTHMLFSFPSETKEELAKTLLISAIFNDTLFIEYSDVANVPSTRLKGHLDIKTRKSRVNMIRNFLKISNKGTLATDFDVIKMSI
jgi:tRNA A37 methylthiotransferase MiaB